MARSTPGGRRPRNRSRGLEGGAGGRRAFTLVELLIVVGIIVVLVGILIGAGGRARDGAHRIGCANNLRQLITAVHLYSADNERYLPFPNDDSSNTQWKV